MLHNRKQSVGNKLHRKVVRVQYSTLLPPHTRAYFLLGVLYPARVSMVEVRASRKEPFSFLWTQILRLTDSHIVSRCYTVLLFPGPLQVHGFRIHESRRDRNLGGDRCTVHRRSRCGCGYEPRGVDSWVVSLVLIGSKSNTIDPVQYPNRRMDAVECSR